jgi:hypothetical protein
MKQNLLPTETGRIISMTMQSPILPTKPISGYRIYMTDREMVIEFKALNQKWGGRSLSLNEFIAMANDFAGRDTGLNRTKISRTKLMGTKAKTANLALSVDEHMIKTFAIFANFHGTSLQNFQEADVSTKQEEFLKLAYAECEKLKDKRRRTQSRESILPEIPNYKEETPEEKPSKGGLTQRIRNLILEQGGKPLLDRGMNKEDVIELFCGAKVKSEYWFAVGEALGIDATELLALLQQDYK